MSLDDALNNLQNKKKQSRKKNAIILLKGREKVLNVFESRIFSKGQHIIGKGCPDTLTCVAKVSDHKQFKILPPKQMLQRLPIALAQVKADNTSENLLNKVHHIIYSLYRAKEIAKKYIAI